MEKGKLKKEVDHLSSEVESLQFLPEELSSAIKREGQRSFRKGLFGFKKKKSKDEGVVYRARDFRSLPLELELLEEEGNKERREFLESSLDKDGVYHLRVELHDEESIFSVYNGEHALNPDLYSYIAEMAENFPLDSLLALDFYLPEDLMPLAPRIERLYRQGRLFDYQRLDTERKKSHRAIVALTLSGSFFVIAFSLVSAFGNSLSEKGLVLTLVFLILGELLSNAEWVLLWEAFDKLFFGESNRKIARLRKGQLATAKCSFHPLETKEKP